MKKINLVGLSLLCPLAALAEAPPKAPEGFVSICTLDENCAVEGSAIVAYGNNDQFVYKTVSGEFLCSAETFDPPKSFSPGSPHCSIIDPSAPANQTSQSSSNNEESALISAGSYAFISRSSGKALSVRTSEASQDSQIVQQDFEQQPHQIWTVQPLENGYYSITSSQSQKSLENLEWDTNDGGSLQQLPWLNSWGQHWQVEAVGDGFVKIVSRTNGQSLDVYEMSNKNFGDIVMWTYWGGENQHWRLVPIDADAESSSSDSSP